MKKLLLLPILFLFLLSAKGQISYQITYGDTTHYEVKAVIQNVNGGYAFLGSIYSPTDSSDIILTFTDSVGSTILSVVYSTPFNDYGFDMKQTPDGGFIICGSTFGSSLHTTYNDALLIKTDQLGFVQWVYEYGGAGNDEAYGVSLSKDHGYFVAGHTNSDGTLNNRGFAMKVDSNGVPVWYHTTSNSGSSRFLDGGTCTDSSFIAAGSTINPGSYNDLFVVKYSNAGVPLWSHRFGLAGNQESNAIKATSDGGSIIAGIHSPDNSSNSTDMIVVKLSSSGSVDWSNTYNYQYEDRATDIVQLTNGDYAITGYSNGTDTIAPVRLVDFLKINSLGNIRNEHVYGDFTIDNLSYSISETQDHGFIMGGVSGGFGNPNGSAYLIKTDSDGTAPACPQNPVSFTLTQVTLLDSAGSDTTSTIPLYTINTYSPILSSISFSLICLSLKVDDQAESASIQVYPNPVKRELNIHLSESGIFTGLLISDVYGRIIMKQKIQADQTNLSIDMENFTSGVYQVELSGTAGRFVKKIVKVGK